MERQLRDSGQSPGPPAMGNATAATEQPSWKPRVTEIEGGGIAIYTTVQKALATWEICIPSFLSGQSNIEMLLDRNINIRGNANKHQKLIMFVWCYWQEKMFWMYACIYLFIYFHVIWKRQLLLRTIVGNFHDIYTYWNGPELLRIKSYLKNFFFRYMVVCQDGIAVLHHVHSQAGQLRVLSLWILHVLPSPHGFLTVQQSTVRQTGNAKALLCIAACMSVLVCVPALWWTCYLSVVFLHLLALDQQDDLQHPPWTSFRDKKLHNIFEDLSSGHPVYETVTPG